jgi:serine/threonine protein phosphatase PrpC
VVKRETFHASRLVGGLFVQVQGSVSANTLDWLKVGLSSDSGQARPENQDSIFALSALLPPQYPGGKVVPFGFFAVADGMGGLSDGGSASNFAVRYVAAKIVDGMLVPALSAGGDGMSSPVADLLRQAAQEASSSIYAMASIAGQRSGSTLSAGVLMGRQLTLAHAGDSRMYLLGAAGLELVTSDHSIAARLAEMGQPGPEDGLEDPSRNRLYRSLGLSARLEPDVATRRLAGHTHLVLCTDGLWSVVSDAEIAAVVEAQHGPQAAADRLIALANERGGPDNISVVVVQLPATS